MRKKQLKVSTETNFILKSRYQNIIEGKMILFCSELKIWKAKSSSKWGRFLTRYLPFELAQTSQHRLFMCLIFFSSNCSKFAENATETVRFLRTFKIWGVQNNWIFRKVLNFSIFAKGSKFAFECVSNGNIQKCPLHVNYEGFWKLENSENLIETQCFSEEKTLSFFKIAFSPKWKGAK